jgi:hypothetical protein
VSSPGAGELEPRRHRVHPARAMRTRRPVAQGAGVGNETSFPGITSAEALDKLVGKLRRQNLRVALAHVHAPAGDMLGRARVAAETGGYSEFLTLDSAVRWASSGTVPGQRASQVPGPAAERQGGGSM